MADRRQTARTYVPPLRSPLLTTVYDRLISLTYQRRS